MLICVIGITGLQLFWNYQNYTNTVSRFKKDTNDALNRAVDKEILLRHQKIILKFKGWLADSSIVKITCEMNAKYNSTVFYVKDTPPFINGNNKFSFGLTYFKDKIDHITPAAKQIFINHFADRILRRDLQDGNIYYYTQKLGDSLSRQFDNTHVNLQNLRSLYIEELSAKGINSSFIIKEITTSMPLKNSNENDRLVSFIRPFFANEKSDVNPEQYLTREVNASFKRPYGKELVYATFGNPNNYFLKENNWLIVSSFLLISITVFCFAFTIRTLLSQQKLAELKDDFINNMTHEINTPLSSISITVDALKTFKHDQSTQQEYLDIISYQAAKLNHLTAQILNTNKIDNTRPAIAAGIEINNLIKKAIKDFEPQIENSNAIINYHPHQNVLIKAEADGLLNVFTNIIDNALKYSAGNVRLDIKLSATSKYGVITFADNGIGILPEYRTKIFDKFFRIPTGNTHDIKGYGLGLSYVKQVIENYKGTISVSANTPYGSVFTIKLPIA